MCDLGHERAYAPAFSLSYTDRGAMMKLTVIREVLRVLKQGLEREGPTNLKEVSTDDDLHDERLLCGGGGCGAFR